MPSQVRSFGTITNSATAGSTAWIVPGNARVEDGVRATNATTAGGTSNYLRALNPSPAFSLPDGATVTSITAFFKKSQDKTAAGIVRDSAVLIIKGGVLGITNKADTVTEWPDLDEEAYVSHGGDLWNETWTHSDVNSSGIGVVISCEEFGGSGTADARIDHVYMVVVYDGDPEPPMECPIPGSGSGVS